MNQILKHTATTLEMIFSSGYADGTVTVAVADADGTVVVAATPAAKDDLVEGRYTYVLDPQPEVALLTVTWAGTWNTKAEQLEDQVDVVGALLFTVAALRAFKDEAVADISDYPDDALTRARADVTDFFGFICGVSFVPRFDRKVLDGKGSQYLDLPHHHVTKILSCSVDGAALDGDALAALQILSGGRVFRLAGWPCTSHLNVTISYEHGHVRPPPKMVEAGLSLARFQVVSRDISDRTIALTNDLGTMRLSVPGINYPTGLPLVDAALANYDALPPLLA